MADLTIGLVTGLVMGTLRRLGVINAAGVFSVGGSWTDFTPTGTWTTNVTYRGRYLQVSKMLYVHYRVQLSGAPDATYLAFSLPAGFTADENVLLDIVTAGDAVTPMIGAGVATDASPLTRRSLMPRWESGGNQVLPVTIDPAGFTNVTSTAPFTFASGDNVDVSVAIPIL